MPKVLSGVPKIVVVGYGFAGRAFHSYLISLVPGLRLHGVVTGDADKRTRVRTDHPSARIYESMDEAMKDPEVDVLVLGTPHDTHHPLSLQALAAGKHVVVDKPMCLNLHQAQEMVAAAVRAERHLLVFHNRRWDSDFLTLRQVIGTGQLGPPESVRWIELGWNRFGTWKSWRASAARGGGRLYDLGAHLLDQLLLLNPSPVRTVYARAHFDFPDTDTPSHAQVTLTFESGATGVLDVTSMTRYEKPRVLAMGAEATFVKFGVDPQEAAMIAGNIDSAVTPAAEWGRVVTKDGPRMVPPVPGRWRSFYEHVAEVLAGRAEPLITHGQMLRQMSVFDAAHASIRSGEVVRL